LNFHLTDLTYSYNSSDVPALQQISISFDSASVIGLAGANGSGKTTLIKILLGQLIGFEGRYTIDDQVITDRFANILPTFRIGYAPDTPILDEALTGFEILSLVAEIRTMPVDRFENELTAFRQLLQIEDWLELKQCREYSSGMRRKIAIAIAYLGDRSFVVLDEPTNDLDPLALFGLKKLIADRRAQGVGTLVSSHMLDFVEKAVGQVILLSRGAVKYQGTVKDLFDAHPSSQTLDAIYNDLFTGGKTK
jgi:ABC-type multidrug transport system ATPase subunit